MFLKYLAVFTAVLAIGVASCSGPVGTTVQDPLPHGTGLVTAGTPVNGTGVSGDTSTVTVIGTGNVNAAESTTPPNSIPVIQNVARAGGSTTQSVKPAATTPNTALVYDTITASAAATITGFASSTFTFANPPTGTVYLAYYNGTSWDTIGSAGTVSGSTVTFGAVTFSPTISLAAGASLVLAVYTGGIIVPPTPVPSPVSSPNPISMSLLTTTTVTVATNAGLAVTAASSNTSVATVNATATAGTNGLASFTVSAVGAGTSTLTFTDAKGQTTTDVVTVTNTLPSPVPNMTSFVIAAADSATITVSTAANLTITATSSNTAAATVTASATANSAGQATFTVAGVASGLATLTFTDKFGDSDTASVDVSPVQDPTFANGFNNPAGSAAWAPCSYSRTSLSAAVNPSPAATGNGSQAPPAATTPFPTVANNVGVVTPPPNLNPNNPGVNAVPTAIPSAVALVGGSPAPSGGEVASVAEGAVGICQTIPLDTTNKYLTFWVYEAGGAAPFFDGDQEVAVLTAPNGTLATPTSAASPYLFAENNCFIDPGVIGLSTFGLTNRCIPATYGGTGSPEFNGGTWVQRGPYDMTTFATPGSPFTLYFGVWYFETKAYPATFGMAMFIANVQMSNSNTFPTSAPLSRARSGALNLSTARATAALSRGSALGH